MRILKILPLFNAWQQSINASFSEVLYHIATWFACETLTTSKRIKKEIRSLMITETNDTNNSIFKLI